jgi:tetratricopeptide (TPR) repeat protein
MKRLVGLILLTSSLSLNSSAQTAQRGAEVRIRNERGQVEAVELYGGSYALVIGAANYRYWPRLGGVRDDLPAVHAALERHGFKVEELLDPTGDDLLARINKFINDYGLYPDNRLIIYFSGHGYTEVSDDGRKFGYVVPVDAPKPSKDIIGFQQKALTMDEIETAAKRIRSKHALFVFDSCFSGTLVSRGDVRVPRVIDYYAARPVRQFITSGADNQEVPDESIFRRVLVRGLEGKADANEDGYITGTELATYLQEQVTYYRGEAQTPQYGKIRDPRLDSGDFIFILPSSPPPPDATPAAGARPDAHSYTAPALAARAMTMLLRGDFEEALGLANQSLKLDGSTALAYAVRGRALEQQELAALEFNGYIKAGLKDLQTANRLEDRNPFFRALLASVHLTRGDSEQAKTVAKEAINLSASPASDVEYYARGLAYKLTGDYDRAVADYGRALQLNPQLVEAYLGRGHAYRGRNDTDLEVADYTRAIELNPRHIGAYMARAVVYYATRRFDLAIANYDKVVRLNPRLMMPYLLRSSVYTDKGDYAAAIASCDEAVKLKPNDAGPYNFRGIAYNGKGDYDRAIADFDKALGLSPAFPSAYSNRGRAYAGKRDYARAIADYSESIRLDPNSAKTYRARADLYAMVGDEVKARADRDKAAELEARGIIY